MVLSVSEGSSNAATTVLLIQSVTVGIQYSLCTWEKLALKAFCQKALSVGKHWLSGSYTGLLSRRLGFMF